MTDPDQPQQLTVAELLAQNPGLLVGREGQRHRRAAPDDDPDDAVRESPQPEPPSPASEPGSPEPSIKLLAPEPEAPGTQSLETQSLEIQSVETQSVETQSPVTGSWEPEPVEVGLEAAAESVVPGLDGIPNESEHASEIAPEILAAERAIEQPRGGQPRSRHSRPKPDRQERNEKRRRASDRRPWRKRHPALQALIVLVSVLALVAAYYVTVLLVAQSKIQRQDVLHINGPEILEPAAQTDADNYLIIVADSGDKAGTGAQITALAHMSADGSRLVIVSFPRTTLVDVPGCGTAEKPVEPFTGTLAMTYARGGARCSVAAVQALTGIRINHYLGVDLATFPKLVDALGGVPVCLSAPLKDPEHDVAMKAGTTELDGTAATNYVRAVAGGSGNDPARASRQIDFISSVFGEVLSFATIVNPVRVTKFAFAAADAFTLDPDTSLGQLRSFGENLRSLAADRKTGKVTIVVPPTQAGAGSSKPDAPTVLDPDGSRAMFDAIIAGTDLPDVSTQTQQSDPAASESTQSPVGASPAPPAALVEGC